MSDEVEALAEQLHAAFLSDTTREGEAWPPAKPAAHRAWRRAAAVALDLGATPART